MSLVTMFQAAAVGGVVGLVINAPIIANYLATRSVIKNIERKLSAPFDR